LRLFKIDINNYAILQIAAQFITNFPDALLTGSFSHLALSVTNAGFINYLFCVIVQTYIQT